MNNIYQLEKENSCSPGAGSLEPEKKPHIQHKLFEELVILGSNTTRFNAQIYSEDMLKSHLQSQPESWMERKTTNLLFPPMPVKIPLMQQYWKFCWKYMNYNRILNHLSI